MPIALLVARALQFWATAILFGGAGLLLALRRTPPGAIRTLRLAASLAGISGLAWFAVVFVNVTEDTNGLFDLDAWSAFASAPFGPPWLLRVVMLIAGTGLIVMRCPLAFFVLGIALVLDQAWLGHAADGGLLEIGVYWLHVLAGFAWTGALAMLCVLAIDEKTIPADGLALFSTLGIAIVAAILGSGIVNALLRGVVPADLAATTYGRLITAKIALFVAMVALAFANRARARHDPDDRTLRKSVAIETGLGLAVLALAAILGVTPPS